MLHTKYYMLPNVLDATYYTATALHWYIVTSYYILQTTLNTTYYTTYYTATDNTKYYILYYILHCYSTTLVYCYLLLHYRQH